MISGQDVRKLKAEIAQLYVRRGGLMADLLQNLSGANGFGDYRRLDERTKEHLTLEIVQLIANWDGARVVRPGVRTDGDISGALAAIVELEEAISALELKLPEG